jgi:predicted metal-dependent hydrolase
MNLSFQYGTEILSFKVEFRKRKTLGIEVQPPENIIIIAPIGSSEDEILETVRSKAKWIVQKLFEIREVEYKKRNKEYVNGESFLYLGRNYSLQIVLDANTKSNFAKLYRGKLLVTTQAKDEAKIKAYIEAWYRTKALKRITERVNYYQTYFDIKPKSIKVKEQQKRWGSCNSKGDLMFNWRSVMAPANVLDYIVVHEMCHLVYFNHSADFWNLLSGILPDYKKRKELLKNYGVRYDI